MTETRHGHAVEGFRLSPQQRRVWRLRPDAAAGALTVQLVLEIEGELDDAALAQALRRTVARHEILRTRFECPPGVRLPLQVIGDQAGAVAGSVRIEGGDVPEERLADERRLADGSAGLRAVRVAAGARSLLVLTASALAADARAMDVLVAELARELRRDLDDADEPMQYADLAEWQNELLEEVDAADAIRPDFARAAVELPLQREVRGGAFAPAVVSRPLDESVAKRLGVVAEARDVSESSLLTSAWLALLWRLGAPGEIVLGCTSDGRGYEGLEHALGPLTRDLPLEISQRDGGTLAQLAAAVEARHDALLEHEEAFSWDRAPKDGPTPYLAVAVTVEESPSAHEAGACRLVPVSLRAVCERADLRLGAVRGPSGWETSLVFDGCRYDERVAKGMLRQLHALLAAALDGPETAFEDLDLLDDESRAEVSERFEGRSVPIDAERCVHDVVAARAAERGEAPAVLTAAGATSWRDLDVAANRVANRLRELGAGPDRIVGLCAERSVDMVVGLLGILKAGAGYLPLDPAYPRDRLAYLLEDSGAELLVTHGSAGEVLPPHGARVVSLDDGTLAAAGDEPPPAAAGPDHLAYVIYTSGSTGAPKGVEVTHRTLVHSTLVRGSVYDVEPGRFLVVSSYAFDSSVAGLFWTLCRGGTLVLPAEGRERDLHALQDLIRDHGVTHTLMLPSLWRVLLEETAAEDLGSLRVVVVAGEACPRSLVELHGERLPSVQLWNEYGPTENTVWSTAWRARWGAPDERVPIGAPIPNVHALVLDERRRPLPCGVPGELYLGGANVARGYLRRPELTAERFVPGPFGGERLYRTGDLVRWRADGALDFLGRVDHQVKVRGHRIELEEVEAALRALPGVQEAAAAAREDAPGDVRLVGYLVPRPGADVDVQEAAAALRERLPEAMVPSAFVVLDSLPLGANGKVDRNALPAPDAGAGRPPYVAPRDAVEKVLAQLWSEVLGAERVGVDDSFFELGGHSLLVTRLVFRMRDAFEVELPLRIVFDAPTLGQLAEAVRADPERREAVEQSAELLVRVAELTDEEVEAMLGDREGG